MSAKYELYLTDDAGRRIALLNNVAFFSISRTSRGFGTCHVGIPLHDYEVVPAFLLDRRVEVWRAPHHGATLREEGSFFLRKYNVYTRQEDSVQIIEFWGRSPIDILRRQSVVSTTLADYQKSNFIDSIMHELVDENFITPPQTAPVGELSAGGSESLGPIVSHTFFGQTVLDVLNDLKDMSFSLHQKDAAERRVFFDVVRGSLLPNGGFGYIFRTYIDLRGSDRTGGVTYSVENGNVKDPSYFEDHLDSFTVSKVLNLSTPAYSWSEASPETKLSRWNTIVSAQQSSDANHTLNEAKANAALQDGKSKRVLNINFVDSPGSDRQPQSLYGVDWDLGDLLPVSYAGRSFDAELETVYISVNAEGKENIVGIGSEILAGGVDGAWVLREDTLNTDSVGWADFTLVVYLAAAGLNFPEGTISRFRFTFDASEAEGLDINSAYMGQNSGSGDLYDFSTAPTQLTWAASGSVSIPAGGKGRTDWAPFIYLPGYALLVAFSCTNAAADGVRKLDLAPDAGLYFKAGNEPSVQNKSGYSASSSLQAISKIEVELEE